MLLKEYIAKFPRGYKKKERERIARCLGVSSVTIVHWESGVRNIPIKYQQELVDITSGKVSFIE